MGGNFHLKLNICSRPIANKYHEGKVKRTLKRELNVPEVTEREANGASIALVSLLRAHVMPCSYSVSVLAGAEQGAHSVAFLAGHHARRALHNSRKMVARTSRVNVPGRVWLCALR